MGGHAIAGSDGGGGGGGGVSGITTITSTDGSVTLTNPTGPTTNLKVNGTFGEDTTLQKANAAATLKKILELIAAYTNNAAGVEASSWTIKVLQAGAQVAAQIIAGLGTLFPAGNFDGTPANTVCGVAVGTVDFGMNKFVGGSQLAFSVNGREAFFLTKTSGSDGNLEIDGTFANITLGGDVLVTRSVDATSSQSNLSLVGKFGSAVTDVVIGPNAVVGNGDNGGFLQLPTMAGLPTGTPLANTGKHPIVIANTANGPGELTQYDTGGVTWRAFTGVLKFSGSIIGAVGAGVSYLDDGGTGLAANQVAQKYILSNARHKRFVSIAITVITNTLVNPVTLTLYVNGAASAFSINISVGSSFGASISIQLNPGDNFDLRLDSSAGDSTHRLDCTATMEYTL
jgi:hypothetical protein